MEFEIYEMKYKISKNTESLRILGENFVLNNENKGNIIINNRKERIKSIVPINFLKGNKIKMVLNKEIYNMSYIFKDCELLETLSYKYNEMQKLKDISSDETDVKFIDNEYKRAHININNDTDGSESNSCSSIMPTTKIESKTDLSLSIKELTKRNINLSYMFSNCNSLIFIPDISIWKINNSDDMVNMSYMFSNCNSIKSLPDI